MRLFASKLLLKKRWNIRQIEENTPYYDIKYYDNTFYIAGKNCIVKGTTPDNLVSMPVLPTGVSTVLWKKICKGTNYTLVVGDKTDDTGIIARFNGLPYTPQATFVNSDYVLNGVCETLSNTFQIAGYYKDTTYKQPAIAKYSVNSGITDKTVLSGYSGHNAELTDAVGNTLLLTCDVTGKSDDENNLGFLIREVGGLSPTTYTFSTEINSMTSDLKLLAGEDASFFSSNLSTWNSVIGSSFGAWKGAYYNGTNYYLCGENGYFAYSNNGTNWVVEKVGNNTWNSVIRAGHYIVLVGDNGYMAYSVIA